MVSQAVSDFFKSILPLITHLGFPGGTSGKESTCQHKRCRFGPQVGKTPWIADYQAPPSMGFSRQEYWSGLPFPPPEDLPNPGIEPGSLTL